MNASEIDLLAQWVRDGMPEGDPSDLPPAREFYDGWLHGTPDVVMVQDEEYVIDPRGPADDYRNFVFVNDSGKDWLVNTYEILPGNHRVVHHVLLFVDHTGISEKLDARAKGPGYSANGAGGFPGFVPKGVMGGWAPGNGPHVLPEGMVNVIPAGARIVMQIHYHKTGKEERDRTKLALYLAKGEVTRAATALPLEPLNSRTGGLRIPPNASNHEIKASFNMPRSLIAVSVTPHMHLLGKDMKVDARLPDGTVIPLVYVKTWDFNWQETYYFKEPIHLPAGTNIEMLAHYDNSAANPANPNSPPNWVTWGEGTNDEMCMAFIEVAYQEPTPYGQALQEPSMFELLGREIRRTVGNLLRRQ
ncbi:MAG: ascorbate-dependent monooxygenase [Planctomycetota bacterium]